MRSLTMILLVTGAMAAADEAESRSRGERIYQQGCIVCHQAAGQGAPPVFPPLAGSDWIKASRERAIRALCEGLSGRIRVNGADYDNAMPVQVLDDQAVADVLTFVFSSWENSLAPVTPDEVAKVRAKTKFVTYEALVRAHAFLPLPPAPPEMQVREVVQLPELSTRMAGPDRAGGVYVLAQKGAVYRLDPANGTLLPCLRPSDYVDVSKGNVVTLGMTLDPAGRLWIVSNQQITADVPYMMNEVVIHRSDPIEPGAAVRMKPWFIHRYPHGVGGFNHGVSHIAFGPDGMLYVSSGSRTDGGEGSSKPGFFTGTEVETTACLWRLDPRSDKPEIEVYARGLRNVYGFAWDASGNLFSVTNGPDANAPEEMDFIERGKHYGFPHQFSDWPLEPRPYPHTPAPPDGTKFVWPVGNTGPAGGGKPGGLHTFDPHSSPAGMAWCGEDFPEALRNGFLVARFGNLLGESRTGNADDVGFDLLSVHLSRGSGAEWLARVETVLPKLGRPIDVLRSGPASVLVLEFARSASFKDGLGWLPGRILELSAKR